MAALIEFVCVADHKVRTDPSITLEQRAWAYCGAGAGDAHRWARIDPTPVETVRSRPSTGRAHLAPSESDEGSLARSPGR
jgi:hypothetical protein